MKSLKIALSSMLLSLLLLGSAFAAETTAPTERVNINTADAATIDRVLINIGPAKAEAIVAYRKANGPFKSVDQLASVKGVGLKTIEKNRSRIQIGAAGAGKTATKPAAKGVVKR